MEVRAAWMVGPMGKGKTVECTGFERRTSPSAMVWSSMVNTGPGYVKMSNFVHVRYVKDTRKCERKIVIILQLQLQLEPL